MFGFFASWTSYCVGCSRGEMRSQGSPAYRDLSGWPLSRLLPPAPDPWLVSQFQRFLCGKTRGFTPISKSRFFFFLHNWYKLIKICILITLKKINRSIFGQIKQYSIFGQIKQYSIFGHIKQYSIFGQIKQYSIFGQIKQYSIFGHIKQYSIIGQIKQYWFANLWIL